MNLILASGSPRRKELLRLITSDFTVIPANIDESLPYDTAPEDVPQQLAIRKALAVSKNYPHSVVLGADTIVLFQGQILGKPVTSTRAMEMLQLLSGKTHQVITGLALVQNGTYQVFSTKTDVTFYPLSQYQIDTYVNTGEPLDKAGGYGIQGYGALLVREIHGDFYNVVGLPVAATARVIQQFTSEE
ncbi:MAG: Maf family protein [Ruminococcus sp.]|nr:Maf family protein [Ruminococcus sp.]